MRTFIDIIESRSESIPAEARQIFVDWQEGYSRDGAWDTSRHQWQKRLIEIMRGFEPRLDGYLYRGTMIQDRAADYAINGGKLYVKKSQSLLESWSKSERIAAEFATEHDTDCISVAIIRQKAGELTLVLDADQVPESHKREQEVLVRSEDRAIAQEDIIGIARCGYDSSRETTFHIQPNLGREVDFDQWYTYLRGSHDA